MGYTHYHEQARAFTDTEWSALLDDVRKIIGHSHGIPLAREYDRADEPPELDGELVIFNGVGDDGHETFVLTREPSGHFEFTKTARKPYDEVVTACLLAAHAIAPGALDIGSDGEPEEWALGRDLYEAATGKPAPGHPVERDD